MLKLQWVFSKGGINLSVCYLLLLHIHCHLFLTFYAVEIFKINIGILGSNVGHVGTIENHRYHVVLQNFPELLCHVVRTQGVFQRQVELKISKYKVVIILIPSYKQVGFYSFDNVMFWNSDPLVPRKAERKHSFSSCVLISMQMVCGKGCSLLTL